MNGEDYDKRREIVKQNGNSVVIPTIIPIPTAKEEPIQFRRYGDLIKIKGFIVAEDAYQLLLSQTLEIYLTKDDKPQCRIPFSILAAFNNRIQNYNSYTDEKMPCNYIIPFPHSFIFNHVLPVFTNALSAFTVKITEDTELGERDYMVSIIFDTFILGEQDLRIREQTLSRAVNIRTLTSYSLQRTDGGDRLKGYEYARERGYEINTFETAITSKYYIQGLLICDCIWTLASVQIQTERLGIILDYDTNLINFYGKPYGDYIYIGMNSTQPLFSNNMNGCINSSGGDGGEKIVITITSASYAQKELKIFVCEWNVMAYEGDCVRLEY